MGRETKTITVTASVSRHNSEQDRIDDAALEVLRKQIEHLIECLPPDAFSYKPMVTGP